MKIKADRKQGTALANIQKSPTLFFNVKCKVKGCFEQTKMAHRKCVKCHRRKKK